MTPEQKAKELVKQYRISDIDGDQYTAVLAKDAITLLTTQIERIEELRKMTREFAAVVAFNNAGAWCWSCWRDVSDGHDADCIIQKAQKFLEENK